MEPLQPEPAPSASRSGITENAGGGLGASANTLRLVVMVAPPGSGKSTASNVFHEAGWVIVNQDDLGSRGACEKAVYKALATQKRVVVDRCNFSEEQRSYWLGIADSLGLTEENIVALALDVPIEVCKERVMSRSGHKTLPAVPSSMPVVDRLFSLREKPTTGEGFGAVITVRDYQDERVAKLAEGLMPAASDDEDDEEFCSGASLNSDEDDPSVHDPEAEDGRGAREQVIIILDSPPHPVKTTLDDSEIIVLDSPPLQVLAKEVTLNDSVIILDSSPLQLEEPASSWPSSFPVGSHLWVVSMNHLREFDSFDGMFKNPWHYFLGVYTSERLAQSALEKYKNKHDFRKSNRSRDEISEDEGPSSHTWLRRGNEWSEWIFQIESFPAPEGQLSSCLWGVTEVQSGGVCDGYPLWSDRISRVRGIYTSKAAAEKATIQFKQEAEEEDEGVEHEGGLWPGGDDSIDRFGECSTCIETWECKEGAYENSLNSECRCEADGGSDSEC